MRNKQCTVCHKKPHHRRGKQYLCGEHCRFWECRWKPYEIIRRFFGGKTEKNKHYFIDYSDYCSFKKTKAYKKWRGLAG